MLRALAIERWVRGLILLLLGVAVLRLKSTQVGLKELFHQDLSALQPFFNQVHFNVSDSATVEAIQKVLDAKQSTLAVVAGGTTIFIPLEVYEIIEKPSWLKAVVLLVNIAAVLYLILGKRLFGIRGGHAAYEATLQEASPLEVEEAATAAPPPAPLAATP